MDHPSIMKLLEDDEDESMHSGADVEALSAALNRDIGGDSSTFSQQSDTKSVGVLPQASSSASQQLLEQWQTSSQEGNISEAIQPNEEKTHPQPDQPTPQLESTQQASDAKDQGQQDGIQPKHDQGQAQLHLEHSQSDQELQPEKSAQSIEKEQAKNPGQTSFQAPTQGSNTKHSETQLQNMHRQLDQVKPPDQTSFQFPKQESSSQHSETQQQNVHQQLNVEQQTAAAKEANIAAARMKGSPSIPFQLLIPIIRPHLDKDRAMQLQSVFAKLRTNEVSKEDFLRVIRNIVGDQMLRQAVNKVHMQLQTQSAKNQQTGPNQYSLQNQASQQRQLPHGAHQYTDSQAFSSTNSMSSSQNQKNLVSPSQPTPASTVQMQMDAIFPPVENSGQSSRAIENSSTGRGMHASQMPSTSKNIVNAEREVSMNSLQGINKQQQHSQRPQTSFPMYGGSSNNFHSHPFSRPPIGTPTNFLRPQPPDSHMRPSAHAQGMASTQPGLAQPGSVMNGPKYELQSVGNEAKRLHGGSLTSHSASQQHPASWQTMANNEQKGSSLASVPYVKQEVVDQVNEPPSKSQLTPDGSSFGSGHISQGNTVPESLNKEGIEKQSSRMGFSPSLNTMGSQATLVDSTLQMSSALVAGTTTKTPSKKPSVGQKKPLEAATNPTAGASKKQKTTGAFHDQSIEHLNDVTAVSGVNLREEEEQLLAAPKEDSRASEATRRVVQAEEERLILQKGPLQKKLADIMSKSGLKRISNDVERCLSMCVEERLRGVISSLIRLSKQRVDIEKTTHRFVITSDVHRHILEVNKKAKDEWDKKQAEEAEKLRKVNEVEGNAGSDVDKDKDDGRVKINKANKEEDDKLRTTAANVAARAAVGGDDMLSKWQLMAEQARQKREGLDLPSSSQQGKSANSRPSPGLKRNLREQQETQRRGGNRKFGRGNTATAQSKVARSISRKDVIAVLEKEPQMSKSTLIYRLYEKSPSDATVE